MQDLLYLFNNGVNPFPTGRGGLGYDPQHAITLHHKHFYIKGGTVRSRKSMKELRRLLYLMLAVKNGTIRGSGITGRGLWDQLKKYMGLMETDEDIPEGFDPELYQKLKENMIEEDKKAAEEGRDASIYNVIDDPLEKALLESMDEEEFEAFETIRKRERLERGAKHLPYHKQMFYNILDPEEKEMFIQEREAHKKKDDSRIDRETKKFIKDLTPDEAKEFIKDIRAAKAKPSFIFTPSIYRREEVLTRDEKDILDNIKDVIDQTTVKGSQFVGLKQLYEHDDIYDEILPDLPKDELDKLTPFIDEYIERKYKSFLAAGRAFYDDQAYQNDTFINAKKSVEEEIKAGKKEEDNIDIDTGNKVEEYLSEHPEVFHDVNPEENRERSQVLNTKVIGPYYNDYGTELFESDAKNKEAYKTQIYVKNSTEAAEDLATYINVIRPDFKTEGKSIGQILNDLRSSFTSTDYEKLNGLLDLEASKSQNYSAISKKISKKENRPLKDFMVVDFISNKALYELKALKYQYSSYAGISEDVNPNAPIYKSRKDKTMRIPDYEKTPPKHQGTINLVATKLGAGDSGFSFVWEKNENGTKKVKNIIYKGQKILSGKPRDYYVIFELADGTYKYDVSRDPDVDVENGELVFPKYIKDGKNIQIPASRLQLVRK
jgi:hypothetical protein